MRWWEDRDRDGNLRPSRLHRIFLGYISRDANVVARVACDPLRSLTLAESSPSTAAVSEQLIVGLVPL
jgi:hypothetical protein